MQKSFRAGSLIFQRILKHPFSLALLFAVASQVQPAMGQVNFKPLEKGQFTEMEEKLIVLRGLEVSADYAFQTRLNNNDTLDADAKGTDTLQQLRLNLKTLFHRDVAIHLNLELGTTNFADNNLREAPDDDRIGLADSQPTAILAREAYLRYKFNPKSAILMGKHEISIGDRRGKIFNAITPGITFDCRIGTWCMPFGMAKTGQVAGDTLYHIGFRYTAWKYEKNNAINTLEVEVFRIRYAEKNIPLGKNLGPAKFNPDDPTNSITVDGEADPSQYLEDTTAAAPIYYDIQGQDIFGISVLWRSGPYFLNFDFIGNKGLRKYHTFQDSNFTINSVKGNALELELGMRMPDFHVGLRVLNGSGDGFVAGAGTQPSFNRDLGGYFEITPGTYRGTRLYFNGASSKLDQGAGLGHSINNTRMFGLFIDVNKDSKKAFEYSFGFYKLTLNEPIPDSSGTFQDDIGFEIDNLIIWNLHKALKVHFEFNAILAGGAFSVNDYTRPDPLQDNFIQGIFRVVYSF